MTAHATDFITPLTMQTLSRNPVVTSAWDAQTNWKPGHIDLADRADLLLIAPATANVIAELAHGLAGNPLTAIALATRAPILIAPAMNGKMWEHPATQANVALLKKRGAEFIGPEAGILACGYEGLGRLAAVADIATRALAKCIHATPAPATAKIRRITRCFRRPKTLPVTPVQIPKKARRRHRGPATTAGDGASPAQRCSSADAIRMRLRGCCFTPIGANRKILCSKSKLLLTCDSLDGYSTCTRVMIFCTSAKSPEQISQSRVSLYGLVGDHHRRSAGVDPGRGLGPGAQEEGAGRRNDLSPAQRPDQGHHWANHAGRGLA